MHLLAVLEVIVIIDQDSVEIMQTTSLPRTDKEHKSQSYPLYSLLPIAIFALLVCDFLFLDAILPLRGLWFYDALLHSSLGTWLLIPTHLLFPGKRTVLFQEGILKGLPEPLELCWQETGLLVAAIVLLFVSYLISLRILPRLCSRRFVLISTALLGFICMLIPVVTSQDIFSYIIYARIGVLYHLNPLTTMPTAIRFDDAYPYIYWVHQPSAYGPTWAIMTGLVQFLALLGGHESFLSMVLLLRLTGLMLHLGSAQIIWSISGQLH